GRITSRGRVLAGMPLHPRLAHMLVEAGSRGAGRLAADLGALIEARDPLSGLSGPPPSDLAPRLMALRDPARAEAEAPVRVDRGAIAAIRAEARRLAALVRRSRGEGLAPGAVLSLAYPDRIAQRRPGDAPRYLLSGGQGAGVAASDALGAAPFLVAADLDGDPREARIRRALPVTEVDLRALHADRLRREHVCLWSRRDR